MLISVLKLIMIWQLGETSIFCCSFQYNAVLVIMWYKAPNFHVITRVQCITVLLFINSSF